MSDLNSVTVIGRLVEKPVLKYSKSGTAVSNLRIANNTYSPGSNEQNQNKVNFFTVVVFGKQAENCEKYLDKGRQVAISGRLDQNSWEDTSGNKRSMVRIIANSVQFIGSRPGTNISTQPETVPSPETSPPPPDLNEEFNEDNKTNDDFNSTFESPIDDTDDIPF